MERAVAIRKLRKLLGDKLGYRVDLKAPTQEERDAARDAMKAANVERDRLRALRDARQKAVLDADTEFQELRAAAKAASDKADKLMSITHQYKITVGTSNDLFFYVRAQGDSWEQVIDKVERKA